MDVIFNQGGSFIGSKVTINGVEITSKNGMFIIGSEPRETIDKEFNNVTGNLDTQAVIANVNSGKVVIHVGS